MAFFASFTRKLNKAEARAAAAATEKSPRNNKRDYFFALLLRFLDFSPPYNSKIGGSFTAPTVLLYSVLFLYETTTVPFMYTYCSCSPVYDGKLQEDILGLFLY